MPDAANRPVVVGSWNIHECRDLRGKPFDPWPEIRKFNVDVLCLQEFPLPVQDIGRKGRGKIRRSSGYPFVQIFPLSDASFSWPKQAIAVLSRYPLWDAREHPLQGTDYLPEIPGLAPHDKGALSVAVKTPVGLMRVMCLHAFPFHHFGVVEAPTGERCHVTKAFHEIDRFIADEADLLPPGAIQVVAGDFNSERRGDLLRQPRRLGLTSAFKPGTVTRYDGRSHDDILVNSWVRTCAPEVVRTKSDHHLLKVEILNGRIPQTRVGATGGKANSGLPERPHEVRRRQLLAPQRVC